MNVYILLIMRKLFLIFFCILTTIAITFFIEETNLVTKYLYFFTVILYSSCIFCIGSILKKERKYRFGQSAREYSGFG